MNITNEKIGQAQAQITTNRASSDISLVLTPEPHVHLMNYSEEYDLTNDQTRVVQNMDLDSEGNVTVYMNGGDYMILPVVIVDAIVRMNALRIGKE